MNSNFYDTIIWGASLAGIEQATRLTRQGKKVLLASRFGFPGGKLTEALSAAFLHEYFTQNEFLADIYRRVECLRFGLLFNKQQMVVLHPEAVKRVCWEIIHENGLEILFHVIPLQVNQAQTPEIELFGREGKLKFNAAEILDFSDDRSLSRLTGNFKIKSMLINSFFSDPLPPHLPGFQLLKKLETPVGQFVTIGIGSVPAAEIENKFNSELDRLSKEAWSKYQARIKIIPIYPELVFVD